MCAKNRMQVQTIEGRNCLKNVRFIDIRPPGPFWKFEG